LVSSTEEGLRQPGETARDFGLADSRQCDHQDVLRQHFLAQLWRQLLAPPAVRSAIATARLASCWPTI
jgi:hypothetical protein